MKTSLIDIGAYAPITNDYSKTDFGTDFVWGVSSSAHQTEGAHLADGKGPSIWDDFSNKRGSIADNANANDACLFYYSFEEDLRLMRELGIKNFRFSISWSRILPHGTGEINYLGVSFYHRLIDACLENGIEPWITLYHWDLPLALERKGGWANREIIHWFEEYAMLCGKLFGDRVKNWMVLNEPMVFTGAGYFFGVHAPGKKSMKAFLASVHHATLCQAIGGRAIRYTVRNARIGTTISCSHITPRRENAADIKAATKVDALLNRLFVEPFLGLGYPTHDLPGLNLIEKYMKPGDDQRMVFNFDFLGIQNYTREIVQYSMFTPIVRAKIIPAEKRKANLTAMKWEIYPEGLYEMLLKFSKYDGIKELIVTENGAAFEDSADGKIIKDTKRMKYLDDHLYQVQRAQRDGANVKGYFVWTLMDNFEWAEGYRPRFGLIYVDFKTQKRYFKHSALWYAEFLAS